MNSITLKPKLNELYILNKFILNELGKKDLQVDLIIEEIFVNIVKYSKTDAIKIKAQYNENILTVEFIDNGIEFNPLIKENPKLAETIDEAKIGGLGILLTKEMADDLKYNYINGENHLTIIKKVKK